MDEAAAARQQKLNELKSLKLKAKKNILAAKANGDLEKIADEMETLFKVIHFFKNVMTFRHHLRINHNFNSFKFTIRF